MSLAGARASLSEMELWTKQCPLSPYVDALMANVTVLGGRVQSPEGGPDWRGPVSS